MCLLDLLAPPTPQELEKYGLKASTTLANNSLSSKNSASKDQIDTTLHISHRTSSTPHQVALSSLRNAAHMYDICVRLSGAGARVSGIKVFYLVPNGKTEDGKPRWKWMELCFGRGVLYGWDVLEIMARGMKDLEVFVVMRGEEGLPER